MQELWTRFIEGMKDTSLLEFIAVFSGIASVWFSRKENILVYPVGLINTLIYIYISIKGSLYGEASVNLYYSILSISGWWLWLKRNDRKEPLLHITPSNNRMIGKQLIFFLTIYLLLFFSLTYLQKAFSAGTIPWADALASSSAFTGMWLMTRKKVESWHWWIITNCCSIPLYFVKGYVFTSVYYLVLLIFAFWGLAEWKRRARINASTNPAE